MKSKRKPITNRELEKRTDILMMEIQKQNHAIDTLFMTIAHYIEMNGDDEKFTKFLDKKNEDGKHKQEKRKSG